MRSTSSNGILAQLWRVLIGAPEPEPETHFFRSMEDVEIAIDWGKRKVTIGGHKIVRATDEQAVWIRHTVRLHKKLGRVKEIDQV